MKILVITESWPPAVNGVATSSVRVVRELTDAGHDTRVIAPVPESADSQVFEAKWMRVGPTQEYTVGRLGASAIDMMRDWRPDLVHIASPLSVGFSGLRAAQRLAIPTVAAYMTDFRAFSAQTLRRVPGHVRVANLFARTQRMLHSMATINVACSRYALDTLREWQSPAPREWVRAIDTQRFAPWRRTERVDSAPSDRTIRIGYAGRLAPEKELPMLAALRDLPSTSLTIIGDGPSRPKLESLLPEATFTGKLHGDEYAEAVSSLDIFVHPGRGETLSQVVLEALSSGVPCVVPDAGSGSTELVQPGISGGHFVGGSQQSLRSAVERLIAEPGKRPADISATVAHRTWQTSMDSLLSSYDEALRGA
ncbi:glycosyltransferase [Epidermidibacterium keratini]|uniref:Glycosyltransferase n=1 Tax=Epidermidibacterium keratini TaxID=1891644 RepID=A0A7L4YP23_9ACTN|nr:glycosyltransferase [Epidermidibacterium keratini]QHC01031.1 glycosyltransferase [Epidermidibacterium keratini]